MSGSSSRSVLSLLQRCVALRQVTPGLRGRAALSVGSSGIIQQQSKTLTTLTACLQRLRQPQSVIYSSRFSLCTKAETPCDGEYPPLPAYQSDTEQGKKEVYIIQVKGIPWSCTAEDLLYFFSDCRINGGVKGIHMPLNRLGKPSGKAFIEMEHEEDVRKALERHRQYLGPRYVEVSEVTNSEAEEILKKSVQPPMEDGVIRIRGMPFSCNEDDIAEFFSGLEIVEGGITIIPDHMGRNSGQAYVQFSSQKEAVEAMQRDREVMGDRYIELFPSSSEELNARMRRRNSAFYQSSPQQVTRRTVPQANIPRPTSTSSGFSESSVLTPHHIHMRGLPFNASGEDIAQFFSPLRVSKILLEFGPDGRPRGEADVYFNCHHDATAAMSRDRQFIAGRYIELFLNSANDCSGR